MLHDHAIEPSTSILPHQSNRKFLIDGGCETTLIFHEKLDLPYFAAYTLLETEDGKSALERYYARYLDVAKRHKLGFVLETPTWRASSDWGKLLGHDANRLVKLNAAAVEFLLEIRGKRQSEDAPIVISGCIGPRGDGYTVDTEMTVDEAEAYHQPQINALKSAGAEMATALTMTYAAEAIGITRAAQKADLPIVVSFTTETDGKLPNGQTLGDAVSLTDEATNNGPIYFMVNCAHPDHFADVLKGSWVERIGGFRANASRMSHAELDEAEKLDDGNPQEFGSLHHDLITKLPNVHVVGGCCGTDHRHVGEVARAFS